MFYWNIGTRHTRKNFTRVHSNHIFLCCISQLPTCFIVYSTTSLTRLTFCGILTLVSGLLILSVRNKLIQYNSLSRNMRNCVLQIKSTPHNDWVKVLRVHFNTKWMSLMFTTHYSNWTTDEYLLLICWEVGIQIVKTVVLLQVLW